MPAMFAHFLQPLGWCGAQKVRRDSSKLSRFQTKIVKFSRRFRRRQHCRAQDNLRDLCSMHQMIVRAFCRRSATVCGCDRADFQDFQRKNRAVFDRKAAQFCAKNARHTPGTSAEAAHTRRTRSDICLRCLRIFCRRWARVVRKKCVEFHRNFRDFKRKS